MFIDQINLNELRIFLCVYEHQNMTRAAESLSLTQSGISQHIKKLEDMLQTPLFDRINKKLVPTSAANYLYENSHLNLLQLENALVHLQEGQKKIMGKVAVGMPIEFGNNIVLPLIAQFCSNHPYVDIQLRMGFATEMNAELLRGKLDFAFVDTFHLDRGIETQAIYDEILYLCSHPSYLKNKKSPVNLSDYESLDYVEYQSGNPVLNMWFEQKFNSLPEKLKVRAYVMDVQGVAKLILNGLGCGVLPSYLVESFTSKNQKLEIFENNHKKVHNHISIAYLKEKTWQPASHELKKYLLENIKSESYC